jgi:hypothetical protein
MRLRIGTDGTLRIPGELLERWGVPGGRGVEASVEKGRLVLRPLPPEGDPFAEGLKGPDAEGFEKALRRDAEEKARAKEEFDRLLREKHDLDPEKEREERDRWR